MAFVLQLQKVVAVNKSNTIYLRGEVPEGLMTYALDT